MTSHSSPPVAACALTDFVPASLRNVSVTKDLIPRLAKDPDAMAELASAARSVPTTHQLLNADAREMAFLAPASVHLVLTSPPYWNLKEYGSADGQLGSMADYKLFLKQLDVVWQRCFDALVPGGRLICVVGDVCLSRRKNGGVHTVVPLHASIQEHCRDIGYLNLTPILWHKIANASFEGSAGGGLLGKPYEPNAVIKNDAEFILMGRKPGGYRSPSDAARLLSAISAEEHSAWFRQLWCDVPGASTRGHPAPYPLELARRLIRMFSFVGDTVLDPFVGSGTSMLAAAGCGRNSIGVEVVPQYCEMTYRRLSGAIAEIPTAAIVCHPA